MKEERIEGDGLGIWNSFGLTACVNPEEELGDLGQSFRASGTKVRVQGSLKVWFLA